VTVGRWIDTTTTAADVRGDAPPPLAAKARALLLPAADAAAMEADACRLGLLDAPGVRAYLAWWKDGGDPAAWRWDFTADVRDWRPKEGR
jgi:hypothetical protein